MLEEEITGKQDCKNGGNAHPELFKTSGDKFQTVVELDYENQSGEQSEPSV